MMKLLNYTTKVSAHQTVGEIIKILTARGVLNIGLSYNSLGAPDGLHWTMETDKMGLRRFALPCNSEAVFRKLTEQRVNVHDAQLRRQQAERTAWRILKDWIEAQMALLETGMVDLEEVFLPYMVVDNGQTLYRYLGEGGHRTLGAPTDVIALPAPSSAPEGR